MLMFLHVREITMRLSSRNIRLCFFVYLDDIHRYNINA